MDQHDSFLIIAANSSDRNNSKLGFCLNSFTCLRVCGVVIEQHGIRFIMDCRTQNFGLRPVMKDGVSIESCGSRLRYVNRRF